MTTPTSAERWLVLLCVSIPSFMINLDANIVAVSLPSIAASLHADFASVEWVISAYTLPFASFVMVSGGLADRFGRKRIMLLGLSVFTIASFVCGAAWSVTALNTARAFQGVGAALQLSSALAILSHEFRGPERAKAFSFWGSVIGIAVTVGPALGGLITQGWGWRWAFYINIPVGLAVFLGTLLMVRDSRDEGARQLDLPGALLFGGALFATTLALISGNDAGWNSSAVRIELYTGIALLAAFILTEQRVAHPMMDLRFFRIPTYVGAIVSGVAFAATLLTMLTFLPLYFQGGLGLDPRSAGLLMLPTAVPLFVMPRIVSSFLAPRMSGRALLTAGLAFIAFGMAWLGLVASRFDIALLLVGLVIAGIGAGILNGETAKVSMSVIPPERAGMASGISGTARFSGIVLGFAGLGAVLSWRIAAATELLLPGLAPSQRLAFAQSVTGGRLQSATLGAHAGAEAVKQVFAAGYTAIFLTSAVAACLSAIAVWLLVSARETAPPGSTSRRQGTTQEAVLNID